jgi:probable HAF family extracellular repeat protein
MNGFGRNLLLAVFILLTAWASAQNDSEPPAIRTIYPTFTTIDVPGAGVTSVQGINTGGEMVGLYGASNNEQGTQGFLLSSGVFTYIEYPGAYGTNAYGINDSNLIAGAAYFNGGTTAQGFTYDGSAFTLFEDGNDSATFGLGINNGGDIVGGAGSVFATRGFELHKNRFKSVSPSGNSVYVYATAINNSGKIVGWYTTNSSSESGFEYAHGDYVTISVPGAFATEAQSLNDNGVVVGWYIRLEGCTCGFALLNGKYLSFGYPGAMGTFPYGINRSGQVVGSYTFDNATYHGFVTSPITAEDFR